MEGPKFIARVNFETNKHHRQNLREQISPQLIQKLEISQNPSGNYMNAYKNVYKEELQKTLEQYKGKKAKDQYLSEEQKYAYITGLQPKHNSSMMDHSPQMPFRDYSNYNAVNNPKSQIKSNIPQQTINGRKFVDYDQERKNKFQTHIIHNYDGGQSFFKVQDAYLQKRQNQTKNYAQILKQQLMMKEYLRMNQKQKIQMENLAVQELKRKQQDLDRQKYVLEQQNRGVLKQNMSQQLHQQRLRKQRRSKQFQYNSVGLHNPILNPIQYHIDNPYILKKIQDQQKQQHFYE